MQQVAHTIHYWKGYFELGSQPSKPETYQDPSIDTVPGRRCFFSGMLHFAMRVLAFGQSHQVLRRFGVF
jgi:hypothetical protein